VPRPVVIPPGRNAENAAAKNAENAAGKKK